MIVIEAYAGMEATKRNTLLYVAEAKYEDVPTDAKGNKALLAEGGKQLPRSESSGQCDMQKVYEDIEASLQWPQRQIKKNCLLIGLWDLATKGGY